MSYDIKRGDIFYIDKYSYMSSGSEMEAGRPAVVVSNNVGNMHSDVVEVVYCTTKPKKKMPTHVKVLSTPRESTVLCEQVTTVSIDRIGTYIGRCSDEEMEKIDRAVMVSLGISPARKEDETDAVSKPADEPPSENVIEREMQIVQLQTELNAYKNLYESLIGRLITGAKAV